MICDMIAIAKEAGEIIRNGFRNNVEIDFKTDENNLVTQIDKASEKTITDFIKKKFPGHGILAEEGTNVDASSEFTWVIDPLDGTSNFAHGFPIFSVSIGLLKNGTPAAGVVYDVMRDVVYAAEKGAGSFANGKKILVSKNDLIPRAFLVTGFPYNIAENPDNAFQRFFNLTKTARAVRRLGSAAIDLCYVADGVFDAFWEINLNPWDIAAGLLIVEEAGGLVTEFDGSPIKLNSKQILASNKNIHNQMIEALKV